MSQYPEQIYKTSISSGYRAWRERRGRCNLEGTKCSVCGAISFPRRSVCEECYSRKLEPYYCVQTGEITSVSVQGVPALAISGYGEKMPRYNVMIKLDDGIHIMSEVVDAKEPEKIVVGSRVKMVVKKLRREANGNWLYGFKFKLDL